MLPHFQVRLGGKGLKVRLEVLSNFTDKALEGEPVGEVPCSPIPVNFTESDGTGPEAVAYVDRVCTPRSPLLLHRRVGVAVVRRPRRRVIVVVTPSRRTH